ncbi:MAG: UDP-N-acetyl-D-mannosamine dehydrogenase [Sulfitobacter sp.]
MNIDRISIVGLGYIGLPTAALFASRRKQVIGIDVSQHVVDTINSGGIHIVEPELDMLVHASVSEGYLRAATEPEAADVFVLAVPTPFDDQHNPDLGYIEKASRKIASVLKAGNLVILESTSPVGATTQMAEWMAEERPDLTFPHQAGEDADIQVAHCPERVLPGHVVRELVSNDRIIGGLTARASQMATAFYKIVVEGECHVTDAATAEMCKLAENSFRDVNIAFANELSLIAARHGIEVRELIRLANRHPRVSILQPGAGVGGHCIAVDPWFLVASAPEEARIIRTAREVNDHKPTWVVDQILAAAEQAKQSNPSKPVRICCLGLAFKPDIDDLRESPAMAICARLASSGFAIDIVEPHIQALPASLAKSDIRLVSLAEGLSQADVVAGLVKHSAFVKSMEDIAAKPTVIDAAGITDKGESRA